MSLGVALKRVFVNRLEMTTVAIRDLLLADVLADPLQFEPDRRSDIPAGPEMLAREVPLLAAQPGVRNRTPPLRKPITEATGCLGGMPMHKCT